MSSTADIDPGNKYAIGTLSMTISNKKRKLARLQRETEQIVVEIYDAEQRYAEARRLRREAVDK